VAPQVPDVALPAPERSNEWFYGEWLRRESQAAQVTDLLDPIVEAGLQAEQPYHVALAARTAQLTGHPRANDLLQKLVGLQQADGRLDSVSTVSGEGALSQQLETTALATLAWMQDPQYREFAVKGGNWLRQQRQSDGSWPTEEAHALALLALCADNTRPLTAPQDVTLLLNDGQLGAAQVPAGSTLPLRVVTTVTFGDERRLAALMSGRANERLPVNLSARYRVANPPNAAETPLKLDVQLGRNEVAAGDTVVLHVRVEGDVKQPCVIHLGLPGGLEPLEPLPVRYARRDGELLLYFDSSVSDKKETEQEYVVEFDVHLQATVAGHFEAPPAQVHPAHAPEKAFWAPPVKIEVRESP
jgi:hypothetical protein